MSWTAGTLDLDGRWNPAARYDVYGAQNPFSRAAIGGMTPLVTRTVPNATVSLPAQTTFFYSVIAADARGSLTPW
jgi:hypothetical protein